LQKEAMRKSKVSAKENIESLKEKPGLHRLKKNHKIMNSYKNRNNYVT
jgi:hypothetical protein